MPDLPSTIVKHEHTFGCDGSLYRLRHTVCMDRIGRVGNGGIVAHDYRCNRLWDGCPARVLVTEHEVRKLAVAAIGDADA